LILKEFFKLLKLIAVDNLNWHRHFKASFCTSFVDNFVRNVIIGNASL